jgi:hypothetical protein
MSCGRTGQGRPRRRLSAEEKEKRKRLVQTRQALEGLALKSLFDFIVRIEATRGARRVARQAPRTARGKRSASLQAKNACHCGDYSKKHSLVEHKSTGTSK